MKPALFLDRDGVVNVEKIICIKLMMLTANLTQTCQMVLKRL